MIALEAIVLANDADPATGARDPLDVGLLRFAAAAGVDAAAMRRAHPVVSDRPFDSAWKYTRVTVEGRDGRRSYVNGAPEVVLGRCRLSDDERESWREKGEAYAQEGHRVLALGWAPGGPRTT